MNYLAKTTIPFIAAIFFITPVHAASIPDANAAAITNATTSSNAIRPECRLKESLDNLLKIQDTDYNKFTKERDELAARKNLLEQTVFCSLTDIDSLRDRLTGLELKNNEDIALNNQFLNNLTLSSGYFNSIFGKITDSITLGEVKELAADALSWRNAYYLPVVNQINDFYLLITSENALDTAKTRLQKISGTLNILRLNKSPKIKALVQESSSLTDKALLLNKKARDIVSTYYIAPVATTTEATSTSTEETTATSTEQTTLDIATSTAKTTDKSEKDDEAPSVLSLVREALGDIKKSYGNYLEISTLVKKYLGL